MSKDTSESAFPESYIGADAPHEGIGNGMSLRDYFAAKAMQAILSSQTVQSGTGSFLSISEAAYRQADAMLLERQND